MAIFSVLKIADFPGLCVASLTPGLNHSISGYIDGGFLKKSDESSAGKSGSSYRVPESRHSCWKMQINTQ